MQIKVILSIVLLVLIIPSALSVYTVFPSSIHNSAIDTSFSTRYRYTSISSLNEIIRSIDRNSIIYVYAIASVNNLPQLIGAKTASLKILRFIDGKPYLGDAIALPKSFVIPSNLAPYLDRETIYRIPKELRFKAIESLLKLVKDIEYVRRGYVLIMRIPVKVGELISKSGSQPLVSRTPIFTSTSGASRTPYTPIRGTEQSYSFESISRLLCNPVLARLRLHKVLVAKISRNTVVYLGINSPLFLNPVKLGKDIVFAIVFDDKRILDLPLTKLALTLGLGTDALSSTPKILSMVNTVSRGYIVIANNREIMARPIHSTNIVVLAFKTHKFYVFSKDMEFLGCDEEVFVRLSRSRVRGFLSELGTHYLLLDGGGTYVKNLEKKYNIKIDILDPDIFYVIALTKNVAPINDITKKVYLGSNITSIKLDIIAKSISGYLYGDLHVDVKICKGRIIENAIKFRECASISNKFSITSPYSYHRIEIPINLSSIDKMKFTLNDFIRIVVSLKTNSKHPAYIAIASVSFSKYIVKERDKKLEEYLKGITKNGYIVIYGEDRVDNNTLILNPLLGEVSISEVPQFIISTAPLNGITNRSIFLDRFDLIIEYDIVCKDKECVDYVKTKLNKNINIHIGGIDIEVPVFITSISEEHTLLLTPRYVLHMKGLILDKLELLLLIDALTATTSMFNGTTIIIEVNAYRELGKHGILAISIPKIILRYPYVPEVWLPWNYFYHEHFHTFTKTLLISFGLIQDCSSQYPVPGECTYVVKPYTISSFNIEGTADVTKHYPESVAELIGTDNLKLYGLIGKGNNSIDFVELRLCFDRRFVEIDSVGANIRIVEGVVPSPTTLKTLETISIALTIISIATHMYPHISITAATTALLIDVVLSHAVIGAKAYVKKINGMVCAIAVKEKGVLEEYTDIVFNLTTSIFLNEEIEGIHRATYSVGMDLSRFVVYNIDSYEMGENQFGITLETLLLHKRRLTSIDEYPIFVKRSGLGVS